MSEVSRDKIESVLAQIMDPHLTVSLVEAKTVQDIRIDHGAVSIDLRMPYPCQRWAQTLSAMVSEPVAALEGVSAVSVNVTQKIIAHSVQHGVKRLENVKNIIKYTKKLMRLHRMDKVQKSQLITELQEKAPLTEKAWMIGVVQAS